MSKNVNGGYRLIALAFVDLASASSGVACEGLYDALDTDLGKKEIRLTQIKVSGVIKNDVSVQVAKSGNDYVIKDVYGYDLTIKKADGKIYAVAHAIKVDASDIDSGEATSGQVLTADGSGGAEWTTIETGHTLYEHNIYISYSSLKIMLSVVNNSNTPFATTAALGAYLYGKGIGSNTPKIASGIDYANGWTTGIVIVGIYPTSSEGVLKGVAIKTSDGNSVVWDISNSATLTDTVTAL